MKKYIFLLFGLFLLISLSCNTRLEKRLYNRGYYVAYSGKKNVKSEKGRPLLCNDSVLFEKQNTENEFRSKNKAIIPATSAHSVSGIKTNDEIVAAANSTKQIGNSTKRYFANENNTIHSNYIAEELDTRKKNKNENADNFLYLLGALMGLSAWGVIRKNKTRTLAITKWANNNKTKSRIAIALTQIALGTLGVFTGRDLADMGYTMSDSSQYFFGGLMTLGFLTLLYNETKTQFVLFNSFFLRKIGQIVIGFSFFMTMIGAGNNLHLGKNQISPYGSVVETIDHSMYPDINYNSRPTEKIIDQQKGNGGEIAAYLFLAIFSGVILVLLACVSFCYGALEGSTPYLIWGTVGALACLALFALILVSVIKKIRKLKHEAFYKPPMNNESK